MIDFESLNREEMETLCNWIGEKAFKTYFGKNQSHLVRIYRDCMVKKLTMQQIYDIVFRNKGDHFIIQLLNSFCKQLIMLSDKAIEKRITDGDDRDTAIIYALADSPFIDNIPLYFKLRDETYSDDYIRIVSVAVSLVLSTTTSRITNESEQKSNQPEDEELQILSQEQQKRIAELENQLSASQSEVTKIRTSLSLYQEKENRLHQLQPTISDYEEPDFQFLSLCRVINKQLGDSSLILERLADVREGILIPFIQDPTKPHMFENRGWLYKIDGPNQIYYHGAWNWRVTENRSDPAKDYVTTKFNANCIPIEVVIADEGITINELVSALVAGIPNSTFCNRMLWSVRHGNGYTGILIDRKKLNSKGNLLMTDPDLLELPVYVFSSDDIIDFGNRTQNDFSGSTNLFLKKIDPGKPTDFIRLYDQIDLMRKMLLERAKWSACKAHGISKARWHQSRVFLEQMPLNDLLEAYSMKSGCTREEASSILSALLDNAEKYLNGQDIPTETLIHAIHSSQALSEYCTNLIRKEWEEEHEQEIAEAHRQLSQLTTDIAAEKAELKDVQRRRDEVEQNLRQKESLAEGVEKRIADRIAAAKQDAAQFISDMAFCAAPTISSSLPLSLVSAGEAGELDDSIIIHNTDDLLDHLSYELHAAGVEYEKAHYLSVFLYSAFCNQIPLLLAGPNALQIANAFSICLTGFSVTAVDCNQDYSPNWAESISGDSKHITAFRNPFRKDWIHSIIEKLEAPDRFYLLIHPFAEDLCIEPSGLMNYMVPVLTEAFITEKASGKYTAAIFDDDFEQYQPKKLNKRLHSLILKGLFIQTLLRRNIQQILTDVHELLHEMSDEMDMLLGVVPAAFILGKGDTLLTSLDDVPFDSKSAQQFLRGIMEKDE